MESFNVSLLAGTIHFNQSYIDYQYQWFQFSTFLAIVPWIYMIPSFFVICYIFKIYLTSNWKKSEPGKNQHVFLVISLSQFTCFLLFLTDFLMTRLPSTGIFTSFCASIPPNHYLKIILVSALYFNYLAMSFPFLLPVIRLIIVICPKSHSKVIFQLK